jgi:hypothetical protein
MPRTFILLADGESVGTASLAAHDLDERPDLTPWLAGVFVDPHTRGRGYAANLIAAIEHEAQAASIATLWLYPTRRNAFTPVVRGGLSRLSCTTENHLHSCGATCIANITRSNMRQWIVSRRGKAHQITVRVPNQKLIDPGQDFSHAIPFLLGGHEKRPTKRAKVKFAFAAVDRTDV